MISLPYAMAYSLLWRYPIDAEDIEKAADIIDSIPAQNVSNGNDPFLQVIADFAMLYEIDRQQAFDYLNACAR